MRLSVGTLRQVVKRDLPRFADRSRCWLSSGCRPEAGGGSRTFDLLITKPVWWVLDAAYPDVIPRIPEQPR
jgi:hypothetical protein